jgi:hypothetical protein
VTILYLVSYYFEEIGIKKAMFLAIEVLNLYEAANKIFV